MTNFYNSLHRQKGLKTPENEVYRFLLQQEYIKLGLQYTIKMYTFLKQTLRARSVFHAVPQFISLSLLGLEKYFNSSLRGCNPLYGLYRDVLLDRVRFFSDLS